MLGDIINWVGHSFPKLREPRDTYSYRSDKYVKFGRLRPQEYRKHATLVMLLS